MSDIETLKSNVDSDFNINLNQKMSDTETLKSNVNSDININLNQKSNKEKSNSDFNIKKYGTNSNCNFIIKIVHIILFICSIICGISVIIILNITGYDNTNVGHVIGITIIAISHIVVFSISTNLLIYFYN